MNPFVGPSYNLESRPSSVQRTVNMMPVPIEPGNERSDWVFKDVPGLTLFSDEEAEPVYSIQTLDYTGSDQSITIPSGAVNLEAFMWGAGGGGSNTGGGASGPNAPGGAGAYVTFSTPIADTDTIVVIVGQAGQNTGAGTYGGGGAGGQSGGPTIFRTSGSGGGRSAIVINATEIATAAGGGGGGCPNVAGGAGGVATGSDGVDNTVDAVVQGLGGTQIAGGANGAPNAVSNLVAGTAGVLHAGGSGGISTVGVDSANCAGGGGGSGYYGGGGGGASNIQVGSGGGGSSLVPAGGSGIAGSGANAPNQASEYWDSGIGSGGAATGNGGHGRVVLIFT